MRSGNANSDRFHPGRYLRSLKAADDSSGTIATATATTRRASIDPICQRLQVSGGGDCVRDISSSMIFSYDNSSQQPQSQGSCNGSTIMHEYPVYRSDDGLLMLYAIGRYAETFSIQEYRGLVHWRMASSSSCGSSSDKTPSVVLDFAAFDQPYTNSPTFICSSGKNETIDVQCVENEIVHNFESVNDQISDGRLSTTVLVIIICASALLAFCLLYYFFYKRTTRGERTPKREHRRHRRYSHMKDDKSRGDSSSSSKHHRHQEEHDTIKQQQQQQQEKAIGKDDSSNNNNNNNNAKKESAVTRSDATDKNEDIKVQREEELNSDDKFEVLWDDDTTKQQQQQETAAHKENDDNNVNKEPTVIQPEANDKNQDITVQREDDFDDDKIEVSSDDQSMDMHLQEQQEKMEQLRLQKPQSSSQMLDESFWEEEVILDHSVAPNSTNQLYESFTEVSYHSDVLMEEEYYDDVVDEIVYDDMDDDIDDDLEEYIEDDMDHDMDEDIDEDVIEEEGIEIDMLEDIEEEEEEEEEEEDAMHRRHPPQSPSQTQ